ncbi:hypothetical protein [Streptomyces griseorubiginosus]|uniref:hypothetical protein n=1 Tax=Streptomyces griseorubiginosus TaxID=67304 RepID=UPI001FE757F4|nr:hypothetical protein [Streptomyces griseorubiginosus]
MTKGVLRDLARPSNVAVQSDSALVGSVEVAVAKDDKKRAEKGTSLRRKSGLEALPRAELGQSVELAPWHVLHDLAQALSLSRQGAGRGLAEHWGSLKYSQALDAVADSYIQLSAEAKGIARDYKRLQSRELGQGFALALARQALLRRYPDRFVSFVSADVVIRAGWSKGSVGYAYRPDFFAEVWKPGEPSRVFPIATTGNHGGPKPSYSQLAACSAHVEAMHIGAWNETPCLVFSTEFPSEGPVTVHVLHARGEDGWLYGSPEHPLRMVNSPAEKGNIVPGIQPPTRGDRVPQSEPGFHVQSEDSAWFQHVVARTATAGTTAFAGDGATTARYLTTDQGSRRYDAGVAHAASGSVQDATYRLLGIPFVGTDHVFRLNNKRVEAFSGVAADLFALLSAGKAEEYRSEIYARRGTWPGQTWDPNWGGPVSIQEDGTVLAMRLLRLRKSTSTEDAST